MEDAYGKGYNAFHRGADRNRNPYLEGGKWWRQWLKGWDDAARVSQR